MDNSQLNTEVRVKEFALGAVLISAFCGALTALLIAMAPLADLNSDRGRAPARVPIGTAVYLDLGMLAIIVLGTCSWGVGAGVLESMSRRKK